MRIDITKKNMVWLVEHKMADTIVAEFHRKEAVIESLVSENARLKAEVERLTPLLGDIVPFNEYLEEKEHAERLHIENSILMKEIARLKAEVERLRKAGDAMAKTIGENGVHDNGSFHDVADSIDRWNAAKEGKQS